MNNNHRLKDWISSFYLQELTIQKLAQRFPHQKPFPYLELPHFFIEEKVKAMVNALIEEQFVTQEADLFKFKQTGDIVGSKNNTLQEFRQFLCSKEFVSYLTQIISTSLKANSVDMAGTFYDNTDFLLCHDDLLEGRKIAYFLYLSDLHKNDGGALNLFASENKQPTEIAATIIPKFNTFAFFLVSEKSFHEVAEVVRDVPRIAISGWFHDQ